MSHIAATALSLSHTAGPLQHVWVTPSREAHTGVIYKYVQGVCVSEQHVNSSAPSGCADTASTAQKGRQQPGRVGKGLESSGIPTRLLLCFALSLVRMCCCFCCCGIVCQ